MGQIDRYLLLERLRFFYLAFGELGLPSLIQYSFYQVGLKSGVFRWMTPARESYPPIAFSSFEPLLQEVPRRELQQLLGDRASLLIEEAENICRRKVTLFGSDLTELHLDPGKPLKHWTRYTSDTFAGQDIKLTWEPARLGWVFTLARAYTLSGDERYAETCWNYLAEFFTSNPPNRGPNWVSAQEVALRILAMAFASQIFDRSPTTTTQRRRILANAIAAHAMRILPTLSYARSQRNNHLLSESAGLYTAGTLLGGYSWARTWKSIGWAIFCRALQDQIGHDGTYTQHSTNYHRLMLHLALWIQAVAVNQGRSLPAASLQKLKTATHWLLAQMDLSTGRSPNLGHNDGAYILPLDTGGFPDFRAVVQAASRCFLGQSCFSPGPWDELSLWLGLPITNPGLPTALRSHPAVHRLGDESSWATLRAVEFTSRPAHADQLHVDLWWQGLNMAMDAGTYQYNAAFPWDNRLALTAVHNTIEVDAQDQMYRAGKFLWLRWAQAHPVSLPGSTSADQISAEHNGYDHLGVRHRRTLIRFDANHWQVTDELFATKSSDDRPHTLALNWLLPDFPWDLSDTTLHLQSPLCHVTLKISALGNAGALRVEPELVRAGRNLLNPSGKTLPYLGWYSPTYYQKRPALSYRALLVAKMPVTLHSEWRFLRYPLK